MGPKFATWELHMFNAWNFLLDTFLEENVKNDNDSRPKVIFWA